MEILDPNEWPLSTHKISKLCEVDLRTAQRWLSGHNKPPPAAVKLIQLTQRNRIIPESWPSHFKLCSDGSLDVGHKIRLTHHMLEHHAYSVHCWYTLIRELRQLEVRLDEIERFIPRATVIELDNYRRRINAMKNRPFALGSGYEAPIDKNVIPFR